MHISQNNIPVIESRRINRAERVARMAGRGKVHTGFC